MAKDSHMSWVGPFRVTKSNGTIVEIQKNCPEGPKDYVHRSHVVKIIPRNDHLREDVVLPTVNSFKNGGEAQAITISSLESNLPINYKKALLTPRSPVAAVGSRMLGRTRAQTRSLQKDEQSQ